MAGLGMEVVLSGKLLRCFIIHTQAHAHTCTHVCTVGIIHINKYTDLIFFLNHLRVLQTPCLFTPEHFSTAEGYSLTYHTIITTFRKLNTDPLHSNFVC